MIVAAFSVVDKADQVRFFEDTFLVANISPEVALEMLFLILSSVDMDFLGWELRWKIYITKEVFLTSRCVKLVGKKEFVAAALNPEYKTFIVYVVSHSSTPLDAKSQISGMIVEEAPTKISAKYSDFADVFPPDMAFGLLEHTGINDHPIKLVDG